MAASHCLSIYSSYSHGHDCCLRLAGDLPGQCSSGGSSVAGAALVPAVAPVVSSPSASHRLGSGGSWRPALGDVLRLSRLEFLQACLDVSWPLGVGQDVVSGSRPSTFRQY